jgi:hypothetical protein
MVDSLKNAAGRLKSQPRRPFSVLIVDDEEPPTLRFTVLPNLSDTFDPFPAFSASYDAMAPGMSLIRIEFSQPYRFS